MQTDTAFKPFVPPNPMFEEPAPPSPAKGGKRERKRSTSKKRPPAADKPKIPPAPKHERPKRKKKARPPKARKPRKVPMQLGLPKHKAAAGRAFKAQQKKRELKMSFSTAMEISGCLKQGDMQLFGLLTENLQSVNKATRRRVLAAIGKVFG